MERNDPSQKALDVHLEMGWRDVDSGQRSEHAVSGRPEVTVDF